MRLRCHLSTIRGERTIAGMARLSGVRRPYLSQIEAGLRMPSDEEVVAIAEAYGAELDEMYDWRPPQLLAVELDPE
jgi:transcriptional regulator with XRE-family HTH domain